MRICDENKTIFFHYRLNFTELTETRKRVEIRYLLQRARESTISKSEVSIQISIDIFTENQMLYRKVVKKKKKSRDLLDILIKPMTHYSYEVLLQTCIPVMLYKETNF